MYRYSLIAFLFLAISCGQQQPQQEVIDFPTTSEAPEWSKNATIYEVNLRQHTAEGTINAFAEHLPQLKALGVDILWLMPIYPISEKFRKAEGKVLVEELDPTERDKYLGSYYAIKDYKAVNPEFGTEADFRQLVDQAHGLGMRVILDIAANHTGWDHDWVTNNPEFYTKIPEGETPWNPEWMAAHPEFFSFLEETRMTYPIDGGETDWWDTADLNYDNDEMRDEMISAMRYWVEEFDVDGYRCDVAMHVPTDFWEDVRNELDAVKPVFMLAEAEQVDHLDYAFDMNYGWEMHHIMNQIVKGEMNVENIRVKLAKNKEEYAPEAWQMNFITNHDENSWNGTINERMGEAQHAMAALMTTLPGMPLLYSGQEAGLDKRLRFFEKDTVEWQESELRGFYSSLFELKHKNQALWNGVYGGELVELKTNQPQSIFAFSREQGGERVLTVLNLSAEEITFNFNEKPTFNGLNDLFGKNAEDRLQAEEVVMPAWDYIILTSK
jgi:glycosidase